MPIDIRVFGMIEGKRLADYTGMAVATNTDLDTRMTILETEFRTELKHLATKADLERLKIQLLLINITVVGIATGIIVAAVRFWQ